jgi:hypothetical protein
MSRVTYELARFRIEDLLREAAGRRRASENRKHRRGARSASRRWHSTRRRRPLRRILGLSAKRPPALA